MDIADITTAFLLGFFGSGHCFVMCGGIVASSGKLSPIKVQLGRLLSYTSLAGLLSLLGQHFAHQYIGLLPIMRVLAGCLLIAMGLYIAQLWFGLRYLERGLQPVWKKLYGFASTPMRNSALLTGLIWGCLPCGLVYSAMLWATLQGQGYQPMLLMFCFGLGTMPAMLVGSGLSSWVMSLMKQKQLQKAVGLLLIIAGVWSVAVVLWQPQQHHMHKLSLM